MGNTACCQKHIEEGNFDLKADNVSTNLKSKQIEKTDKVDDKDGTGGTNLGHKEGEHAVDAAGDVAKNLVDMSEGVNSSLKPMPNPLRKTIQDKYDLSSGIEDAKDDDKNKDHEDEKQEVLDFDKVNPLLDDDDKKVDPTIKGHMSDILSS